VMGASPGEMSVALAACRDRGLEERQVTAALEQELEVENCQVKPLDPCATVPCETDPCANTDPMLDAEGSTEVENRSPLGRIGTANCSLIRASMEGNVQGIKQALSDGADINTRLPMLFRMLTSNDEGLISTGRREPSSLTALMHASNEGHVDAVKFLLGSRAKVDLQETDGMQAIHFAAQAKCAKCFRALLDAGADPLARDDSDQDALQYLPLGTICRTAAKHEWLTLLKEAGGMEMTGGEMDARGTKTY